MLYERSEWMYEKADWDALHILEIPSHSQLADKQAKKREADGELENWQLPAAGAAADVGAAAGASGEADGELEN